ncbi:MAG TPA: ArsR family transcriptional regulator [Bryobacteraceae bacterium]|nr:ArsR family transcriptional regulator [Bryobacteraceae bacterium]
MLRKIVVNWLDLAPATVSHHLKELENADLIEGEGSGKFAYLSVRPDYSRLTLLTGI